MTDPAPNPYAAPESEIRVPEANAEKLASPWIRLGAQIIDGLILFPLNYLMQKVLFHVDQDAVTAATARGDVLEAVRLATPPYHLVFLASLIGIAALVAINWKFLPKGQTIGKKVAKIQIQARDGSLLPVNTLIGKRILPLYVAASIPLIGGILVLIDVLCIFRARRNTLHDDFAGSKVVNL